jgi:hypothetical protein
VILQVVSTGGAIFANIMHNAAVARGGPGTPIPPPAPQGILTPEQMAAAQAGYTAGGGPVAGVYPTPTSAAPPGPPVQHPPGGDSLSDFVVFFQRIERPLLSSWNDGEPGHEFAAKLIELGDEGFFDSPGSTHVPGRSVYDMVHSYGQSIVGLALKTYPPIWDIVKLNQPRWETFLSEFFHAEEIWEKEETAEEAPQAAAPAAETLATPQVLDATGDPVLAPPKRRRA